MKELCAQDEKLLNEVIDLVKTFYASKSRESIKEVTLKEKENSIIYVKLLMKKDKIEFQVFAYPKTADKTHSYHISTKYAYSIGEAIDYIPKLKWVEYE